MLMLALTTRHTSPSKSIRYLNPPNRYVNNGIGHFEAGNRGGKQK